MWRKKGMGGSAETTPGQPACLVLLLPCPFVACSPALPSRLSDSNLNLGAAGLLTARYSGGAAAVSGAQRVCCCLSSTYADTTAWGRRRAGGGRPVDKEGTGDGGGWTVDAKGNGCGLETRSAADGSAPCLFGAVLL